MEFIMKFGGMKRYPDSGYAKAEAGQDLLAVINAKNVSYFEVITRSETTLLINGKDTRKPCDHKSLSPGPQHRPVAGEFFFFGGGKSIGPRGTVGIVNSIISKDSTEYFIAWQSLGN
jgi:hypothetical protein